MTAKPVVLDTAVILNLLAADAGEAILQCLQTECLVTTAAAQEVLYVRSDDPAQPARSVSVDPWRETRLITIVAPDGPEEENLYVQFASELDDGEAMSLAICQSRRCILATDDRKARRLANSLRPEVVNLLSTAEILHCWAARTNVQEEILRLTLQAIERRARFVPAQGDAFRDWWLQKR
jgi:predicted nucleic acid-binding protein